MRRLGTLLAGALLLCSCKDAPPPTPSCEVDPEVPGCGTHCEPGAAMCDPEDGRTLLQCDPAGAAFERIGECGPGLICFDEPGGAPRCRPRECEPGVLECDGDGAPRILVCDAPGASRAVFADCADGGGAIRCGPAPVCVDDGGGGSPCDEDSDCPQGRCTAAGRGGAPRRCVPTVAEGEACGAGGRNLCERGSACVVEHRGEAEAVTGVCRPTCDPSRNDCPEGQACLLTSAGGVCSTAVAPRHRTPCDTGRPAPCDAGVVIAGLVRRCVPLTRPTSSEACDGIDDVCDGESDEGYDLDGDPLHCGVCHEPCGRLMTCEAGICTCPDGYRDADGAWDNGCECLVTEGGVEICDRRDNDCDGAVDEGFDGDDDGWPSAPGCHPTGRADCADDDPGRNPGVDEACDGVDEDCDDGVDEDFDLSTDPSHCGACGRSCVVAHAERRCIGGLCPWECAELPEDQRDPGCALRCLPGHLDENGLPDDGCEATPCTLAQPPVVRPELRVPLPAAPHGLTWAQPGQGWLLTADAESGQHVLRRVDLQDGVARLGPPVTSEEVDDVVFPMSGVAWDGAAVAVVDAERSRIVLADPEALVAFEDHLLPAPPGGGGWRALAGDGDGWWFSHDVDGAVLEMRPGENAAPRVLSPGPAAGLDVDTEGDRVLLTVGDRLCRYVASSGACLGCATVQGVPGALGAVGWDGEELWVVDAGAPALLRVPPPYEEGEEPEDGRGP